MIRLLSGDCRDVLATLPAESVQCVVTSPPYYGLRDYGTALWDGGAPDCDHTAKQPKRGKAEYTNGQGGSFSSNLQTWGDRDVSTVYRDVCGKCGAVRVDRQIGLEADPETYLATMVGVFREVRRVLRRDGTCWVNMGDSYANTGNTSQTDFSASQIGYGGRGRGVLGGQPAKAIPSGLKPKDLLLMPARLALALQADGWWVRSDIIWHKPNPMPESVTDRPTSAHEHVFLLTRSARYYYDADAVREDAFSGSTSPFRGASYVNQGVAPCNSTHRGTVTQGTMDTTSRNLRNVWTIATHAYPDAHFATFPPELAERCIKAGTSERGCCAACGKPWVRVTETHYTAGGPNHTGNAQSLRYVQADGTRLSSQYKTRHDTTTGWSPGCQCGTTETRPCVVLDCFAGAGTTLLVADRLQRDAIGIELNTAYTEMAMERCRADAPLFTSFPPAEPPEDERMADLFTDMAAD